MGLSMAQENLEKLNSQPLLLDCLINNSFYTKAMVDTGCLCFSVIDEGFVRQHKIFSERITPRYLRLADGSRANQISRIARIKIDQDGRQELIWGYMMPKLSFPMILGKPWMEKNDVVYSARRRSLRFGSRKHGLVVRASGWYENKAPTRVQERVSQVRISMVSQISQAELSENL